MLPYGIKASVHFRTPKYIKHYCHEKNISFLCIAKWKTCVCQQSNCEIKKKICVYYYFMNSEVAWFVVSLSD